ncbi:MAG: hypothetical protein AAF583_02760 [Pseudomonadota bacterium]
MAFDIQGTNGWENIARDNTSDFEIIKEYRAFIHQNGTVAVYYPASIRPDELIFRTDTETFVIRAADKSKFDTANPAHALDVLEIQSRG